MRVLIDFPVKKGNWGGGNSFLRALRSELQKSNRWAYSLDQADVLILNSHQISLRSLISILRSNSPRLLVLHRIDGPLRKTRGSFLGQLVDLKIQAISRLVAHGVIYQSVWSAQAADAGRRHRQQPAHEKKHGRAEEVGQY